MDRFTITMDHRLHRALKEASLCEGCCVRSIIEDCLMLQGIRSVEDASILIKKARDTARLLGSDAMKVAQSAVGAVRGS